MEERSGLSMRSRGEEMLREACDLGARRRGQDERECRGRRAQGGGRSGAAVDASLSEWAREEAQQEMGRQKDSGGEKECAG